MAKTLLEMAAEIVTAQAGEEEAVERKAVQEKASIQKGRVTCLVY